MEQAQQKAAADTGAGAADGINPGDAPAADGWLATSFRKAGLIQAGIYTTAIVPRDIAELSRAGRQGVSFIVAIAEGAYAGYEIRLEFITSTSNPKLAAIARRDLDVLEQWRRGLGAGEGSDAVHQVMLFGEAGEKRAVVLDIGISRWGNGAIEYFCKSVTIV